MALFNMTGYSGGYPSHLHDESTGIWYIAAAFDVGPAASATKQDVLIVRTDAGGTVLPWADGTLQKVIVSAAAPAGSPSLGQNKYDPEQPLTLLHGTRRFLGTQGGELWTELT